MKTINYSAQGTTNNAVPTEGGVYADRKNDGTYGFELTFPGKSSRTPKTTLSDNVELVGEVKTEPTSEGNTKVTGTVRFKTPNTTGKSKGAARFGVTTNEGKFDALIIEDATGNNVIVGLKQVNDNRSLTTMSEEFKNESENYLNLVASLTTYAREKLQVLEVEETADAGK